MHLLQPVALAAYTPRGPRFSWDTLPVFYHGSNASGPASAAGVEVMARFPMVTVEKFQGPCAHSADPTPACHQEELIVAELKKVKAANPNISTVFYMNSVLDFPQYQLHTRMLAEPALMKRDPDGNVTRIHCPSPAGTCDVFDFAQKRAIALFTSVCINATRSGFVDGCFLDRAVDGCPTGPAAYTAGHLAMQAELQAALGDGPVVSNHAYGPPFDNLTATSGVTFAMIEGFGANNQSIQQMLAARDNVRGVQAHAGGRAHSLEDLIAAFLVAAYRCSHGRPCGSYFGMGGWSDSGALKSTEDHWNEAFAWKLGAPAADAVYRDGVWTRSFEHVNVTFDALTGRGRVQGWTFPTPPPPPPPPGPAPKPTAQCPTVRQGCGYTEFDLKPFPPAKSWAECCAACAAAKDRHCAKWVFHAPGGPTGCHLHTANASLEAGSGVCGEM